VIGSAAELVRGVPTAAERFPRLRVRCREVFEQRYAEPAFIARRTALYRRVAAPQPAEIS
jgi:hypothetical protein